MAALVTARVLIRITTASRGSVLSLVAIMFMMAELLEL